MKYISRIICMILATNLMVSSAVMGSAALGRLADLTSITDVYRLTAFLPLLGLIAGLLPDIDARRASKRA